MQLLLKGHGIVGFVDGSYPCPSRFLVTSREPGITNANSSSQTENEDYVV